MRRLGGCEECHGTVNRSHKATVSSRNIAKAMKRRTQARVLLGVYMYLSEKKSMTNDHASFPRTSNRGRMSFVRMSSQSGLATTSSSSHRT